MSISLAAATYAVVYTAVDDSVPMLHDAPSLPSLTLSVAEWTFTQVTCVTCGPGGAGGNTGRQYCLNGAVYTTVQTIQLLLHRKHDFVGVWHVRVICICGVYA